MQAGLVTSLVVWALVGAGCDRGDALPKDDRSTRAESWDAVMKIRLPPPQLGLAPTYGLVDIRDPWRKAIASALGERHEPELQRGARDITYLTPCTAVVAARSSYDAELSRATFLRRNGEGWQVEKASEYHNGAVHVVRFGDPLLAYRVATAGTKPVSQEAAIQSAAVFVANNYDLFGLDRDDVLAINEPWLDTGPGGPAAALRYQYELTLDGNRPEPAFRDVTGMNRHWVLMIYVDVAGRVTSAAGRIDEVAGVIRCKKPQLDASAIAQRVAGQALPPVRGFIKQRGATVDDAARIESVEPTAYRSFQRDPDRVVVRFGYEVIVKRQGLTSTLYFDGDTGAVVGSRTE
jgi:hypothetical protein